MKRIHTNRGDGEMKKDIKWLKEEIWKQDIVMDKGYIYTDDLMSIINEVDEPEVLSQEWIERNTSPVDDEGRLYIWKRDLQNLLVPKQEEVDQAYKDGYEKGKEYTFYKGYLEGLADKKRITEEMAR